jgi:alcohol dehydrogenase
MHSTAPFAFDWQPRTRLIFGPDTLERVGETARELGGKRALLVTDAGIVKAGHAGRAVGFIAAAGLQVEVYDSVRENPSTVDVADCVAVARRTNVDIIIGLGAAARWIPRRGAISFSRTAGR